MDVTAIILLLLLGVAVGAATAAVTWGLVLEARSNREWHERKLAL
jgi:hypothetical protein